MNKTLTFAIAFTLGAALTLVAAGEQDHPKWMKAVKTACDNTKKGIEAKDADAVAKEAKTLAGCYKTISAFYADRHADDAVEMCKSASGAIADIQAAAAAKDFDKAAASFKALTGSCGGCHKAHREKGEDGAYKIK